MKLGFGNSRSLDKMAKSLMQGMLEHFLEEMDSKIEEYPTNRTLHKWRLEINESNVRSVLTEFYDMAKLLLVRDLMNDKNFIKGREMVFRNGIAEYQDRMKELYKRFTVYEYFNRLPYEEQKSAIQTLVVVDGYIKNDEHWLKNKIIKLYPKEVSLIMMISVSEQELNFGAAHSLGQFALNKGNVEELCDAFYVFIANMLMNTNDKVNLDMEIDEIEAKKLRMFFAYDNRVLLEQNENLITNEMTNWARVVYEHISSNEKWKYKEKKTVDEITSHLVTLIDNEEFKKVGKEGLVDYQGLAALRFDRNKLTFNEWIAFLQTFNFEEKKVDEEKVDEEKVDEIKVVITSSQIVGILTSLKRFVETREKVVARSKLFEIEVDEMVRAAENETKKIVNKVEKTRQEQAGNQPVTSEKELELENQLKQLKNAYNMTKNNLKLVENENRKLKKQVRELEGEQEEGELLEVAEFENEPMVQQKNDYSDIELPQNIVMITGHPNLRKKISSKLNWDTIDIDKHFELGRVSRADLIVYNSESNNHRAFESLEQSDLDKMVYVNGVTNLKLIVEKAKEEYATKILIK